MRAGTRAGWYANRREAEEDWDERLSVRQTPSLDKKVHIHESFFPFLYKTISNKNSYNNINVNHNKLQNQHDMKKG